MASLAACRQRSGSRFESRLQCSPCSCSERWRPSPTRGSSTTESFAEARLLRPLVDYFPAIGELGNVLIVDAEVAALAFQSKPQFLGRPVQFINECRKPS